jgi:UDP-glucose 4-epimerase
MTGRILVTGAGGFVCRHIVDALMAADYRVVAVDQAFDEALMSRWSGWPVEVIKGDVSELPALRVDAVIHGAAVTASPEENTQTPEENFHANLNSTLAALTWARQQDARRTICISSAAVLRDTMERYLPETTLAPVTGLYAAAKQAMEALTRTLRAEFGQDVISIRLGNIYGTWEQARPSRPRVSKVQRLLLEALETGSITIAVNSATQDWTFAADVGRAVVALLRTPTLSHALYHVVSPEAVDEGDIAAAIGRELPEVEIHRTLPTPEVRGVLVSERLTAETGFDEWTPFAEGIRQCIAELRGEVYTLTKERLG